MGKRDSLGERDSTNEAVRIIEAFETLPIGRRVEIFRNLSPLAREQLVATIYRPGEVMRQISSEEIFFTVKQLGEPDALGLLAATTSQQLTYLLDIELWKKDMFDTFAAIRWLDLIASIGEEKMLQFVQTADPELIATALNRFIKVQVRNPEVDLVEQLDSLPQYTLDDLFFVEFRLPEHDETIKRLLETLLHWNVDQYFGLMEELAIGLSTENEESAGRSRRSRLADHGFPEFGEALEIYRYLQRNAVAEPRQEVWADLPMDEFRSQLWYPLKVLAQENLFRRCIKEITDTTECDRLSTELAHLANKVMVADGRDPGSLDQLEGSLKKAGGYINIALEEICGDDPPRAAQLLRSNHMEILFRRGFSIILDLRKEVHHLLRSYEGGVENLGYPLAGLAQGLLQKRPYYAENVFGEKKPREFETLDDIQNIRDMMNRLTLEDTWEPI